MYKFICLFDAKLRKTELQYVYMGYQSIFEKDLMLKFKKGILIDKRVIDKVEQMNLKSQ